MGKNISLTLDNIPKELRLILKIINAEHIDTVLRTESHLLSEVDWNLFLKQIRHHRIYPLVYLKLKRTSDNFIPHFIMDQLSHDYKRNTLRMLHLSGEVERLSKVFLNKNVNSIYLKGPVLAQELYGDVSFRTSSDLDLLISIDDLTKVEELLICEGYEKDDYIETVLNDWKWRHHHVTYFHSKKRVKVEVHWRMNPGPGKEPSFNDLWDRRRQSHLTSAPVYLLGKEDMFLFLSTHGSRHGWSRLRWLIDMKKLMECHLDWEGIQKLLKEFHYVPSGEQTMILVSEVLEVKMPPTVGGFKTHSEKTAAEAIFYLENMVNLHTDPVPEYIAKYHKKYLFSLMSIQQKFLFLLSLLHPYPEDIVTLPLPKRLHFLYYLLRPILWGWRKFKLVLPQRGQAI